MFQSSVRSTCCGFERCFKTICSSWCGSERCFKTVLLFSRADAVLNCDFKTLSVHPRAVLKPNLSLIHANFAHDLALHARLSPLPLHQVRAGHRIKLTIDDVTFEASNVRVSNDVVAVQILDAVVRGGWTVPSKYGINFDKTAHHWILAHTSGTGAELRVPGGHIEEKAELGQQEDRVDGGHAALAGGAEDGGPGQDGGGQPQPPQGGRGARGQHSHQPRGQCCLCIWLARSFRF